MLTPAAAAALSVPEREDVVEGEDRGRQRAALQPRRHRLRDRRRPRSRPRSSRPVRRAPSASASSTPATRSRMLLIVVADATTQQPPMARGQQPRGALARRGDIVHGHRVELGAIVERPVEDDERDAVALQCRAARRRCRRRAPRSRRPAARRSAPRPGASPRPGSPPLVATSSRRPALRASRSSRSTISAKNGLPSSGTTAPTTVRLALRRAEAATSRW